MEYVFHEKQEGSLCAQHCLNSLLQGDYYSAVDLANIARELDAIEHNFMADAGNQHARGSAHESSNYDDTGYFSIQVLQNALKSWNLELIPYSSSQEVAQMARELPTEQRAYICNFRNHWYTIRKIGPYWFNLNSLLARPELISDLHLSILLAQLINDGYSIFIVDGDLPRSQADTHFNDPHNGLNVREILQLQSTMMKKKHGDAREDNEDDLDDELKKAIRMSLIENDMDLDRHGDHYPSLAYEYQGPSGGLNRPPSHSANDYDENLKRAIEMSMENDDKKPPASDVKKEEPVEVKPVDPEEIRRKRLEFLEKIQNQNKPS